VAPLGVAERFHPREPSAIDAVFKAHAVTAREYFLCVGTLEPRKNLGLALRAHALLPEPVRQRFPLLIVGMAGWERDQFSEPLRQALASGHVCLLGYLPDEQVAQLLAGARALIFPSLYEGLACRCWRPWPAAHRWCSRVFGHAGSRGRRGQLY
jgi:glycosyltransferase involved in cell wall biosynthesis